MTWFTWLILMAAVLAIAAVGLTALGSMRWAEAMQLLTAGLEAGRVPTSAARYDPSELAGLPVPVQRYFRTVLTPGQAVVSTRRPGFVWDARIALLPISFTSGSIGRTASSTHRAASDWPGRGESAHASAA
ncbi:MAG: hypothetical protein AB3X44_17725 [Leptothrix sp. (in: b-proteobacteria)]